MKSVDIFGVNFAITDYKGAVNEILDNLKSNLPFKVFALPVHGVIEYQNDEEFRRAVDAADMIVPDGQPVRWAMNYFYDVGLKDRVYGPFLMRSLLEEANQAGMSVFLYGGKTKKVLSDMSLSIQKEYPKVNICGAYREDSIGVETLSIEFLNECEPDIVFVGLGCPNQEKWIARNGDSLNAATIGVGAAFNFYAGEVAMAPSWMQERGLEWLYRLCMEPRRLWKRYLYTNSYFVFLFITKLLFK